MRSAISAASVGLIVPRQKQRSSVSDIYEPLEWTWTISKLVDVECMAVGSRLVFLTSAPRDKPPEFPVRPQGHRLSQACHPDRRLEPNLHSHNGVTFKCAHLIMLATVF